MTFTGPDPISSCGCSCSSATKCSEPALFLPSRGCDGVETCSDDGVRYFNGELQYAVRALSTSWWSHTLVYSNRLNEDQDFGNGVNWMVKEWWQLFDLGTEILVLRGSQSALWFDKSDLTPKYGSLYQLAHPSGSAGARFYILVSPNGTATKFYDFEHAQTVRRGKMESQTTPGGQVINAGFDSNGQITAIDTTFTSGGTTTIEKFVYAYSSNRVSTITLQRQVGGGGFVDLRRVRFEYYLSAGGDGSVGDLKKVVSQFLCPTSSSSSSSSSNQWTDHDFHYFRYYASSSSSSSSAPLGFVHGLKLAVGPQGCERIGPSNLEGENDSVIAADADHYVQYDANRRVTKNVIASKGFAYEYSYFDSSFSPSSSSSSASDATNSWVRRTTRKAPDNSYVRVYTNAAGQVMLEQLSTDNPDSSPGSRWIEYQQFDANYHLTMRVSPFGIDMAGSPFNEASPSLAVQQKASDGLFRIWDYGSGSPQPAGYLIAARVRKGTSPTPPSPNFPTISTLSYSSQSITVYGNSFTIYKLDSQTAYRTAPESDAIATNFTYTFHGSTAGVNQRTIQLPTVPGGPTGQNGTGATVYRRELYDIYGNQTATQDERGYISTYAHDLPTGAVTQVVQDAAVGDTGWTRPTGAPAAMGLTTDNTVDDEGRVIESLGPIHEVDFGGEATEVRNATWNVYRDECDTTYDETWSAQGFQIVDGGQKYLVNPVSISRAERTGLASDGIVATRGSTVLSAGALSESDSFPLSSWVRLTHEDYNFQGQLTASRLYHKIPTILPGTSGTDYNETKYIYDPATGRRSGTMTPRGTITRSVYDVRGLLVQTQVGTNDFGFSSVNFITSSGPENLEKVSANVYDGGVEGRNGNLTQAIAYILDDTDTRVTDYVYDFRNRQEKASHNDGTYDTYTVPTYDNLNQMTKVERYLDIAGPTDTLLAKSETSFDNMGRVYESRRYSVENGTEGPYLRDQTWHDDAGNVIKTIGSSSEAFTKTFYDAIGRTIRTQMGYEIASSSSSSSSGSSLDKIFAQTSTIYDDASNAIETESLARYHDFTGTGDLVANTNSRPTYTAYYPEVYPEYSANVYGRESAVAQYGTNGETTFDRPPCVPGRTDLILINSTKYNIRGEAEEQTDPRGIVAREEFDNAGRRTARIENYVSVSSSSSSSTCWTDDQNFTTTWAYDINGPDTVTVHNASTGNQTTQYLYGVTVAGGSKLASNDILHQITFPGGATHAYFEYNRQGEKIKTTDQNGTIHEFTYDQSGRLTVDQVTFASSSSSSSSSSSGTAIDKAIDKIVTAYDERGRVFTVTDWFGPDAPSPHQNSVHSQIRNEYNGLDMLVRQYQEHIGVVRPVNGTSSSSSSGNGPSLYVDFNFDMTVVSGVYTKGVRPTSIVYPNGRFVNYGYGTSGGDDDKLSRIAEIKDNDNTTVLAAYDYLGANRVVIEDYVPRQVKLDYTTIEGESSSSSSSSGPSTKYPGFDRFGRVIKHQWYRYGGTPGTVDRFDYTYDPNSNPLTKQSYACTNTSELRTYDGLNRLKTYKRGALSGGSIPSPARQEDFSLDATANWKCYNVSGSVATALVQTQTHNELNEIDSITNSVGDPWFEPEYDDNGNMIQCPQPSAMGSGFDFAFDAWNRLVRVSNTSGSSLVTSYQYDGLSRRIVQFRMQSGDFERAYYAGWTLTELRSNKSSVTIPLDYLKQFIHSSHTRVCLYDWQPISTVASSSSSSSTPPTPLRFYIMCDAAQRASSLLDSSSVICERYIYAPNNVVEFIDSSCGPLPINESEYGNETLVPAACFDSLVGLYLYVSGVFHPRLGSLVSSLSTAFYPAASTSLNPIQTVSQSAKGGSDEVCCVKSVVRKTTHGLKVRGVEGVPGDYEWNTRFELQANFDDKGDCVCRCCEFRQEATFRIELEAYVGERSKPVVILQKSVHEDFGEGGRHYGHRKNKNVKGDEYSANGCQYNMYDSPGIVNPQSFAGPPPEEMSASKLHARGASARLVLRMCFIQSIIDFCEKEYGRVKWREVDCFGGVLYFPVGEDHKEKVWKDLDNLPRNFLQDYVGDALEGFFRSSLDLSRGGRQM